MRNHISIVIIAALSMMLGSTSVFADGTETLGDPSIEIDTGTGIIAAGTGLDDGAGLGTGMGTIDINIPGTVVQAIMYWSCFEESGLPLDDQIVVDGTVVNGDLIGGPTLFFSNLEASTHRADVTTLGLVSAGANSLSVSGLDCAVSREHGAGLLVIYDDGVSVPTEIQVKDGNDLAFFDFTDPLDRTELQEFEFTASSDDRTANIILFFSSVADDEPRPSTIEITVGGIVTELHNQLASLDGNEWDTVNTSVTIPAGATKLTIQAFSEDREDTGYRPASFNWSAAGLSFVVPGPPQGGDGCTPGYWKQAHHFDSWVGFNPTDSYNTVFGVTASFDKDLLGALEQGGGGEKALGRHATAALLNSSNPDVSYAFTTADVIALVQQAYASGNFQAAKNTLETENELGCPLN